MQQHDSSQQDTGNGFPLFFYLYIYRHTAHIPVARPKAQHFGLARAQHGMVYRAVHGLISRHAGRHGMAR